MAANKWQMLHKKTQTHKRCHYRRNILTVLNIQIHTTSNTQKLFIPQTPTAILVHIKIGGEKHILYNDLFKLYSIIWVDQWVYLISVFSLFEMCWCV